MLHLKSYLVFKLLMATLLCTTFKWLRFIWISSQKRQIRPTLSDVGLHGAGPLAGRVSRERLRCFAPCWEATARGADPVH